MTVKELIEQLDKLDPNLLVFTTGYEGGFNDAIIGEEVEVILNYHTEWYYGKHEFVDIVNARKKDISNYETVKGIVL
jgi:hypothetical protein